MDLHTHHALLSAMWLLLAEDQCGGRFVFNRLVIQNPSKPSVTVVEPQYMVSRTESGPGGDNPKSQLQTVLARAGHSAPIYKSKQLDNSLFQSTVEFNGMQIMGKPFNVKKHAEKDAAAEALQCLMGEKQMSREYIDQMSMMLKKSKKDHV